jgi:hypothetical protein
MKVIQGCKVAEEAALGYKAMFAAAKLYHKQLTH